MAELAYLEGLLGQAREAHGGAALVTGEPGIGKTELLRAVAETAGAEGYQVLTAQGAESEAVVPLAGLYGLLRPVAGRLSTLPAAQAAALAAALEPSGRAPADRLLLAAAVLTLLADLGREMPVLVCADDVQWLDLASLHALAFAARRLDGERVAMLFAARDCAGDDGYRGALAGVPELRVARLELAATRTLVEGLGGAALAGGAVETVVRMAVGNPLAAVELVGALTPAQRAGRAAAPVALPPGSRLARAYLAGVHGLPAPTRTMLLLAATADDDELSVDMLLVAAAEEGLGAAALEPAERAGLVRVDRSVVRFGHPLARAAVYDAAPLARRRAAHEVLARVYGRAQDVFRAAWHRAAAAELPDEKLADDLADAAIDLRRRGGYAESSVAFERAAQLSAPGPARTGRLIAAARDSWLAGRPQQARVLLHTAERSATSNDLRGRVDLLRGDIELSGGDVPTAHGALLSAARQLLPTDRQLAIEAVMRAGQAASLAGDDAGYLETAKLAALIRRPHEDPKTELIFEYLAGVSAVIRGDAVAAGPPLRRVVEIANSCTDTSAAMWAAIAGLVLGDVRTARAAASRAVATARAREAVASIPQALEALVHTELAAGRYLAARPSALEGLRLAEETGQDNCASQHLAALAVLAAVDGDEETCLDRIRVAGARAKASGLGLGAALITWAEATLHLAHGRAADAAARFRASAEAGIGRTYFASRLLTSPFYVEAASQSGDRVRARQVADVYGQWARATGYAGWLALSARCEGLLADGPAAEEHFREALRLHAAAAVDFERARTELILGTSLRRQRRPGAAREHLYEALETFTSFGARLWVERTQAELRAAGEAVRPASAVSADQLTAQQLQIARCVAHGATNREVAAQLYLSPRTVDHHLRNIYTKLGIRSRVELARLLG
jgi:DNA-binding CsgD family transcriptional regulator